MCLQINLIISKKDTFHIYLNQDFVISHLFYSTFQNNFTNGSENDILFSSIYIIASKRWFIYTWICCFIRSLLDRRELHLARSGWGWKIHLRLYRSDNWKDFPLPASSVLFSPISTMPGAIGHTLLWHRLPWWLSGQESTCNAGDGFDFWVGKIPWKRAWQPTSVVLPSIVLLKKSW